MKSAAIFLAYSIAGIGIVLFFLSHPTSWAVTSVAILLAIWVGTTLDQWQWIFVVTLLLLFCSTSVYESLVNATFYPRYGAAFVLAIWSWRGVSRKLDQTEPGVRWLVGGLWGCVGIAGLSVLWSLDRTHTIQQAAALALLAAVIHGLVTHRWFAEPDKIISDISAAALLFAAIFAAGIVAVATGAAKEIPPQFPGGGRFRGLFFNANALGITTALVLCVLWGLWLARHRKIYLLAMLPTAYSLVQSESRTALVVVGISVLWVFLRNGLKVVKLLTAGGITVTAGYTLHVLGVIHLTSLDKITQRFTTNGGSDLLTGRNVAWGYAWDQWKLHPVSGIGYSAGPALFQSLRNQGELVFDADVVHNSYLQWLLEVGLIGVIPLLVLLVGCFAAVMRSRPSGLEVGLVAAVLSGLLIQITESAMFGTGSTYSWLFWPVVAAALVYRRSEGDAPRPDLVGAGADPLPRAMVAEPHGYRAVVHRHEHRHQPVGPLPRGPGVGEA